MNTILILLVAIGAALLLLELVKYVRRRNGRAEENVRPVVNGTCTCADNEHCCVKNKQLRIACSSLVNGLSSSFPEYKVLKNTLVRIALNELGYKEFDESLNGPTAVAFGMEDAIAPAKVTSENMEKFKALEVKCGMMDNKYVDAATVAQLAKVPSKPALLSMLLSVLQAPVRGLAVSLNRVAEQKG